MLQRGDTGLMVIDAFDKVGEDNTTSPTLALGIKQGSSGICNLIRSIVLDGY